LTWYENGCPAYRDQQLVIRAKWLYQSVDRIPKNVNTHFNSNF